MPRKEVYEKYRKQTLEYNKKWAQKNPEKVKKYKKNYLLNNPEKRKESVRKYDQTHKEKRKQWEEKNMERLRRYSREYSKKHPEQHRAQSQKRRDLLRALKEHYTQSEWEDLKRKYNYQCLGCGKREPEIKLTTDHVIPLTLGGDNTIGNIQPLHDRCNSKKGNRIIDFRILIKQHNFNEAIPQEAYALLWP